MGPPADSATWLNEVVPSARRQVETGQLGVPHAVLGMLLFVVAEVMFFAGLVSAHAISRSANFAAWPPPGQPRLPVEVTGANTLLLLSSGVLVWLAGRAFAADAVRSRLLLLASFLCGAVFVGIQGLEWIGLVAEGLTLTASAHGAFFYLLVGLHALHAFGALGALAWAYGRHSALSPSAFWAVRIFWYFVVGVWPVLYLVVYLS